MLPNTIAPRSVSSGKVTLSKDEPLLVDLTIVPSRPTATNTPEPEEDEVVLSALEVLAVLLSSDFAHEETKTKYFSYYSFIENAVKLKLQTYM